MTARGFPRWTLTAGSRGDPLGSASARSSWATRQAASAMAAENIAKSPSSLPKKSGVAASKGKGASSPGSKPGRAGSRLTPGPARPIMTGTRDLRQPRPIEGERTPRPTRLLSGSPLANSRAGRADPSRRNPP